MTQTASVTMVERLRLLAQGARFPAVPVVIEAADALETAEKALEAVKPLVDAAHGLSFGTDWNNGTAAKTHGYRRKLLKALPKARATLERTRGQ